MTVRENFVACDVLSQLQRVMDNPRFSAYRRMRTTECRTSGSYLLKARAICLYLSRLMSHTPREKPPQISPIFISDKVTLRVSREKDGKWRLVYAGWDDTKVVQPDGYGQTRWGM
jgi:hypothetical protein